MYAYPYRILRFKEDLTRNICIYFKTRAAMEQGAHRWARRDGADVGTEEYCDPSADYDDCWIPMWGWWLDGVVKPA